MGTYNSEKNKLKLVTEREKLLIYHKGERITLERRRKDYFYMNHPDFNLFLLHFGYENGEVVEMFIGSEWLINERYSGTKNFKYPKEWETFTGHYRSYNPWISNFRVVLRKGSLVLIEPFGEEIPLTPRGENCFWIGGNPLSSEFIRFDIIINRQATRANRDGCEYFRTFTP